MSVWLLVLLCLCQCGRLYCCVCVLFVFAMFVFVLFVSAIFVFVLFVLGLLCMCKDFCFCLNVSVSNVMFV